jgi:ribonuclease HII
MGPAKLWPDPEPDTYLQERCLRQKGYKWIAGLDEVGRGPLAGPVVAAAVILREDPDNSCYVDSKTISAAERVLLCEKLRHSGAVIGIGIVSEADIDRLNILQASLLAMKKAVLAMPLQPDFLLVDGNHSVPMTIPQETLVKGESKSCSIAAASIIAKVARDTFSRTEDIPLLNTAKQSEFMAPVRFTARVSKASGNISRKLENPSISILR